MLTFYALEVSFLTDIFESRQTIVLKQAWLQQPTQEQIDATVQRWIANVAEACDQSKCLYKIAKILSVKVIDFIVEIENAV
ncbi:MAG: hypothetical protein IM613_12320 [Cytophagales bacterium]|nr:hypothetical protein [Cytophagales bacterium]